MKYVILTIFALVAYVYGDEWNIQTNEDLNKYRTECVTSLKVPEAKVTEYRKWNFPDDETTRCYIKCVFNKMGIFDDKTGPNVDRIVQQLAKNKNQNEIRPKVEKCKDKNEAGDNACVWAYRGFKCFKGQNLDLIQASVKAN